MMIRFLAACRCLLVVSVIGCALLTAGGINYGSVKAMKAMKMLEELEQRLPVGH